jgi:hypothetical protein
VFATAMLVLAGGHAAVAGAADGPPGGGSGAYPDAPRLAAPDYRPPLTGEQLIEKLGAGRLVFIQRQTFQSNHFYTDFINGCTSFGGNLCILDLLTGKVSVLLPEMSGGIFDYLDLSFDARKVVFGWKKSPLEGFRIFECQLDGSGLRQLTFPPPDEALRIAKYANGPGNYRHQTDDMQPCYLPDGGIVFTSTRCEFGTLCNPSDQFSSTILHRMDGDGSHIEPLTHSAVSEFSPTVTEDGRILYTRWEYVDKGQLGIKCLWSMMPDGTASREVYGNDIAFPPTMLHGRQIPGHGNLFVMLGTPHFPQSGIGTVIVVDTNRPIRTKEPMSYVTPWVDIQQEGGWNQFADGEWTRHTKGPLYMSPFPLSDQEFLVSHNPDRKWNSPDAYGIHLIDRAGGHTLIYKDGDYSCWYARPVVPRPRPPVVRTTCDAGLAEQKLAVCMVSDVYQGLEKVARGEVKWLRIMEQLPRPWASRRRWRPGEDHTALISKDTALAAKVLRGIVPVEADGSARFYVPADRNIYFSALDGNYLELQRERTYVNYRPGESRSCVGCHETPGDAPPPANRLPLAAAHPPLMPRPQPGDSQAARPLQYPDDVQPVLDRYCVSCHAGKEAAGGCDLTGELTTLFSRSYETLLPFVPTYREASDFEGSPYVPARTIGSAVSRLTERLLRGCPGAAPVPVEARLKITTWIDASGVYYGSYWGRLNIAHRGHPNFRPTPTLEQALGTVNPWEEWQAPPGLLESPGLQAPGAGPGQADRQ